MSWFLPIAFPMIVAALANAVVSYSHFAVGMGWPQGRVFRNTQWPYYVGGTTYILVAWYSLTQLSALQIIVGGLLAFFVSFAISMLLRSWTQLLIFVAPIAAVFLFISMIEIGTVITAQGAD